MMEVKSSTFERISSQDIQNAYLKFYPCIMQYLWDLNTVMYLANLEIAIYKRFPEKEEMEKYIDLLEIEIRDTYNDESDVKSKEFKESFEELKNCIESYEDDKCQCDIYQVQETVDVDEILGTDESESDESGNKVIHVGRVVKR